MPAGDRKDPYRAYNFLIEIDGITRAGFQECSGLDATQDPIEYREGTDALTPRKLPSINKYSNISLKWGITDDSELWDWRKTCMDGKVERKNGSIVLLNDAGEEKLRWNFVEAWPTKWTGPSFNATGAEVAIESLDIAHEGISKA
ncbi:MAG: phage tail protein [Proteobacteria bacterium]|nr:phage tail protein [Pseudomonadota bacterium]MBU1419741.1 phage tail protein [Pseudomonadota bacterium]MBU1455889.1 phage tail protein [Pseudomonadota bacterium]